MDVELVLSLDCGKDGMTIRKSLICYPHVGTIIFAVNTFYLRMYIELKYRSSRVRGPELVAP